MTNPKPHFGLSLSAIFSSKPRPPVVIKPTANQIVASIRGGLRT
jgi:hypothetical protein